MIVFLQRRIACKQKVKVIPSLFVKKVLSLWMKHRVTIRKNAIEQYFHVVLFIIAAQGGSNFNVGG